MLWILNNLYLCIVGKWDLTRNRQFQAMHEAIFTFNNGLNQIIFFISEEDVCMGEWVGNITDKRKKPNCKYLYR